MVRFWVLIFFVFVGYVFADYDHSINIGVKVGYSPNLYPNLHRDMRWIGTAERVESLVEIVNRTYMNPDGTPVVSDFKVVNKYNYLGYEAGYNYGVPVMFQIQYRWRVFAIRVGFSYYMIKSVNMTYRSRVGPDTVRIDDPKRRLYDDIDENFDGDEVYVPEAYGLRPTYGLDVWFRENIAMERWEIPITFTMNVFMVAYVTVYIGGGVTIMKGSATRTIYADGVPDDMKKFFVDDIDRFTASGIGLNTVLGVEFRRFGDLSLIMELYYTYGESGIVKDEVITGPYTNNTLFHSNDEIDWGGTEIGKDPGIRFGKGVIRYENLSFNAVVLYFGVLYYVFKK